MEKTKVEQMGRILIPKSIREKIGIRAGEEVEIRVDGKRIVIKPLLNAETLSKELKGCVREGKIKPKEIKDIWRM